MKATGPTILSLTLFAAFARADFQTVATGFVGTSMLSPQKKSGLDYGQKTTSAIDIVAHEATSRPGYSSEATSRFQVLTEMGRIHAKAETFATHDYVTDEPGYDGGVAYVGPNYSDFTNQGGPLRGDAYAGGSWYDTVHVESSTLPLGTRVQFLIRMKLDATIDKNAPVRTAHTGVTFNTFFDSSSKTLEIVDASATKTWELLAETTVGRDAAFGAILNLYANTSSTIDGTASFANIDAWNTGAVTLECLTPGVTYTTDSGYLYQPVPEPASLAVLGLGAGALLRRRKRAS